MNELRTNNQNGKVYACIREELREGSAWRNGNLASQYDCGDHIHENQAGADIIIEGFRQMIFN